MPVIDVAGFDSQHKPMWAIDDVLDDYHEGHLTSKEFASIVNCIVTEWRQ